MEIINTLLSGSYLAVFILQIACIVHVIKQGTGFYWIFLILFFPVLGLIIYFFIEILPDLKGQALIKSLGKKKKATSSTIRKLEEQVQYTNTIENRLNLADAYLSRGEYSESAAIYADCLSGQYINDATIMHRLAEALYGESKYPEAKDLLLKLKEKKYRDYLDDREFLLARCYRAMNEKGHAIHILKGIVNSYPGEEARYHLGALYLDTDNTEEAIRLFQEIVDNRKLYKKASIGNQNKWVSLSRKKLKEIRQTSINPTGKL